MIATRQPSEVIEQIKRQSLLLTQQISEVKGEVEEALSTPKGQEFSNSEYDEDKEVFEGYLEALTALEPAEKRFKSYLETPNVNLTLLEPAYDDYRECCSDVFDSSEELLKRLDL